MNIRPLSMLFSVLTILLLESGYAQNNEPPELDATLIDSIYCVGTDKFIVENFSLTDPDNTPIDGIFIQISSGYNSSEDQLIYTGSAVQQQWFPQEGKLRLFTASETTDYQIFIDAVKATVYRNSSAAPTGERRFSITLDQANYLPTTGHYYEFIQAPGISWKDAKAEAESKNYYGLQGYLTTITTPEESQLVGEQATDQGWIGGSDEEDDFTWKWMTGPEAGSSFWFGLFNGTNAGADYTFENWANNEPNNWQNNVIGVPHAEDYLHVYNDGRWNDYPNTNNAITGYCIEYGGMPGDPELKLSADTKIIVGEILSTESAAPICGSGSAQISATSTTELVHWYDSPTSSNIVFVGNTFPTPVISTTTTYYAAPANCDGVRVPVVVEVLSLPIIQDEVTLKNCDIDGNPDGFTDFNLSEADNLISLGDSSLTVTYHLTQTEAETSSNPLAPYPFNNSTSSMVFGRVENALGCFEIATVELEVSTTQFPPGYVYEMISCDNDNTNDGITAFDLTIASAALLDQLPQGQNLSVHYYRNPTDAQLELNEITPQDIYRNETPNNQTLFVRIEDIDNGDCFDIGPFVTLTVFNRPEFEVYPEGTVCLNNPPLEMEILNSDGTYNYIWTDPNGAVISESEVAQAFTGGMYSVVAYSAEGCESFVRTIDVTESEPANLTADDITVIDDSDNNSIAIDESNLGGGTYEYTLDNPFGFYQDEPYFEGVEAGIHTVYVRDKNGCGVVGVEVSVIGFPRFFTPNNDGYNDTWHVRGVSADFYPTSLIYIFDRYGKLLMQLDPRGEGWDGFYNGTELPASDYWFSVQLIDKNNNIRERKGHFSLIRR